MMNKLTFTLALLLTAQAAAQATQSITVYTGRAKTFVEPIVRQFERDTKLKVNVRYGSDAELLAALAEEGTRSPADVFWGNSVGAMGRADAQGLFTKQPTTTLKRVAENFVPDSGNWVPTTVRFRTLAYNTQKVKAEQMPASVFDLPKLTQFKGRIGWTVSYSSFQDFLSAMITLKGEDVARQWLKDMMALQPKDYGRNNVGMLDAMRTGEIDIALTNHYYIQRVQRAGAPIETHFFGQGDLGSLGNATGAAILKTSKNRTTAQRFVNYLISKDAQTFFLGVNFEYPVIQNIPYPTTLAPFDDVMKRSPKIAPEKMDDNVSKAQRLLRELGLL